MKDILKPRHIVTGLMGLVTIATYLLSNKADELDKQEVKAELKEELLAELKEGR